MKENDYSNAVWLRLIKGEIKADLSFLAAKVLLYRIQAQIRKGASTEQIEGAKREIFNMYLVNKDLPSAKKDLLLLLQHN